jgi:cell division protein DivIC
MAVETNNKKTVTKKKKKKQRLTPLMKLICFVVIAASAVMLVSVAKEVYTTMTLKKQLAEVQQQLQEVEDENSYLTSEKEKLEDPDYVASYARGNYLLTKDDEQIFYLPESQN